MRRLEFWPDYGGALLWTEAGERVELDSVALPEALRREAARWLERYDDTKLPWEDTRDDVWLRTAGACSRLSAQPSRRWPSSL